jgi:hypothetical protein
MLILLASSGNAQIYKGILIAEPKGTPVEYANVGIVDKNIGTTSNMDGQFELKIPSENFKDSIRFSMIGYETVTLAVSDFINRKNDTIWMAEKTYSLPETVISTSKSEIKILGNNIGAGRAHMHLPHNGKGVEIGVILNLKKGHQALLQTLMVHGIAVSNYMREAESRKWVAIETKLDSLRFRVNVYRFNSKDEFENILTKPVYITYKPYNWDDEKTKTTKDSIISAHPVEFDLSEYQLVIDSKSLITLEFYDDVPQRIMFRENLIGPGTYAKATSQGKFYKFPLNASMGLSVRAKVMKR